MNSSLANLKSLVQSSKTVSGKEKEEILFALEKLEKEIEEKEFIMRRLKKDKSIIVNILQTAITDLEKSKEKIEESNIQLRKHQKELKQKKKIIENNSQTLKENLKKLEHSYNELEDFTHIASHDLKSPLRSISGFAYLLQKKYGNKIDEEADKYLDFIVSASGHMHEVIEALLKYSKVGKGQQQFEEVNLNKILEVTLDNLSKEIEDNHAKVYSTSLPTIIGDKISLVQLFQNLIANAIKFKSQKNPVIKIICQQQQDQWQFKVRDNGIGMDEHFNEKVFIPFQRLEDEKRPGLGLGLAICKKVIVVHGGTIHFENNPEGGTTFIFYLPVSQSQVQKTKIEVSDSTLNK
ncbi:MAG: hypothetical protein DWQ02_05160 [Bacteroidetes bacterium]|nr:MAG: hypothetical protein DWQ02_05160 [Bacteroidota bacterium]